MYKDYLFTDCLIIKSRSEGVIRKLRLLQAAVLVGTAVAHAGDFSILQIQNLGNVTNDLKPWSQNKWPDMRKIL